MDSFKKFINNIKPYNYHIKLYLTDHFDEVKVNNNH